MPILSIHNNNKQIIFFISIAGMISNGKGEMCNNRIETIRLKRDFEQSKSIETLSNRYDVSNKGRTQRAVTSTVTKRDEKKEKKEKKETRAHWGGKSEDPIAC